MPMFPVIFTTHPVGSPYNRKDGEQVAFAQGETLQEAEDLAATWLSDLSESARVYTPANAPARALGPVRRNPGPVQPATKLRADAFVIYAERSPTY